jgi:hypothetical protein
MRKLKYWKRQIVTAATRIPAPRPDTTTALRRCSAEGASRLMGRTTPVVLALACAAVLLCCAPHGAAAGAGAPQITGVASQETETRHTHRSEGSTEGGTRLWVRGINFSDEPGGNAVFIGGVVCPVIQFLTTSTVIVLDTVPLVRDQFRYAGKDLPIAVVVDGQKTTVSKFTFKYRGGQSV